MIHRLILKSVSAREEEVPALLWATAYGFCVLFAYYVLRAVRDEISAADRGNLQYLWTAVFLVMLVLVPMYSWAVSRWPRAVFVPVVNRFFLLHLVLFYAALMLLPAGSRAWIDRVFYVWASVFALFVVSVHWGLVVDCFRNEQGRRLFGFVALGSSLGGLAGSAVTATLATSLPPFSLLLIACVPLELASWCARGLHRNAAGSEQATREGLEPVHGNAWTGIATALRSPYLRGIAGYILLMTFASTVLYFVQADMVRAAVSNRAARTALFARIDLWSNLLTIVLQVWLASRIVATIGVGWALAALPVVAAAGFTLLAAVPTLPVLIAVQVAYRGLRYGLAKPTREVLYTVVSRDERYKSKAFLDAAIYRGGDLASGWIVTGLKALGFAAGGIAAVAVPAALIWAALAVWLGARQDALAAVRQRELPASGRAG